jgi:S-adenosyl methyltransferase
MTANFDTTKPNVARIYDYWLGGKDNFEVDRQAAEAVRQLRPQVARQAVDNKRFQTRAIGYVAGRGVRQFLDIGSGLPTSPVQTSGAEPLWLATHEAAQAVWPDALVAYVDRDPVAVLHSQALLASDSPRVVAVGADMRDPQAILGHDDIRAAGFDLAAPACVILACVLHFVDAETARDIVTTFARALAAGSYLVISLGYGRGEEGRDFARSYNTESGIQVHAHTWEQIAGLFDGLKLVPPGLADAADWEPDAPAAPNAELAGRASMIVAGVGLRT